MKLLDLHIGRPVTRGALTVFPVWNGAAVSARGYDGLSGTLLVEERSGAPVVEELVVTNTGKRPVLVVEGELLEGGQQHRVAAQSVMVAAGASLVIAVRCVEAGRWSGTQEHDRSRKFAPMSVRAAPQQSATWERVGALEARYGGGGDTSATPFARWKATPGCSSRT